MRFDASRSSEPNDCVKAFALSLQPLVMIASWISSWTCFHSLDTIVRVEPIGQGDGSLECHPAHELRVHEVAWFATDLPDPLVLLGPAARGGVGERDEEASSSPARARST